MSSGSQPTMKSGAPAKGSNWVTAGWCHGAWQPDAPILEKVRLSKVIKISYLRGTPTLDKAIWVLLCSALWLFSLRVSPWSTYSLLHVLPTRVQWLLFFLLCSWRTFWLFQPISSQHLPAESRSFNCQCSERCWHLRFSFFVYIDFFNSSISPGLTVFPYNFMKSHLVTKASISLVLRSMHDLIISAKLILLLFSIKVRTWRGWL